MRVLIVGPSIERSKGGMATVINNQLDNVIILEQHQLSYIISHVEGGIFEKAFYALKSLSYILFQQHTYDIVHFHTASDASFYRKSLLLRVSKWLNKKTIIHVHGSHFDSFYLKSKPLLKKYIKSSINKSNKVLVLSNYWKGFFDKEFTNEHVEILKNGINLQLFERCTRETTSFNKYLFLGRLGQRKGVYDLLKAIDIIVHSYGRKDLVFYLAGDGEIDEVKKIINSSNLIDNVKLLGWLNNDKKRLILKEVETVILPSYDEGLPMALIEAMACGKIIISTYAGGIPDLVKPDFNGYLFNAGDVDELVRYILFVNDNPNIMIPISKNNISTVANNFNEDILALQLNTIYNTL